MTDKTERVARAIARQQMGVNMLKAPQITQDLYIDAVWQTFIPAAEAAIEECEK